MIQGRCFSGKIDHLNYQEQPHFENNFKLCIVSQYSLGWY